MGESVTLTLILSPSLNQTYKISLVAGWENEWMRVSDTHTHSFSKAKAKINFLSLLLSALENEV